MPPFLNSPPFSIERRIRDPLYNYIHITELENKNFLIEDHAIFIADDDHFFTFLQ